MTITKNIFERVEKKYFLRDNQYNRLIQEIRKNLARRVREKHNKQSVF